MKKILAACLAVMMIASSLGLVALAETAPEAADPGKVSVHFTISDSQGKLVLTQEVITVSDLDNDKKLTINDAFIAAHDQKFEGGAAAGYAAAESGFITKMWGVETSSIGYFLNNTMSMGISDPIKDGDYLNAFFYTDPAFGDAYSYFDKFTVSGEKNGEVTLTLNANGYDASFNPVTAPVEGATITINGEATTAKTDKDGKATVKLDKPGRVVISAVSDTKILVPPVCMATVSTDETADLLITLSGMDKKFILTQEKITVKDADKNGVLDIMDAMIEMHDQKFEGGAKAGFATMNGDFGAFITKLWGVETGNIGYYLNNQMAMGLNVPVKTGDALQVYFITDAEAFSDAFCFFDQNSLTVKENGEISLTLSYVGFDADYNPVNQPAKDAFITVNGEKTEAKTDADGKVTFTVKGAGEFVISAVSDTQNLVPAVCKVTVTPVETTEPETTVTEPETTTAPETTVIVPETTTAPETTVIVPETTTAPETTVTDTAAETTTAAETEKASKGCSSAVASASAVFAMVTLIGAASVLVKKKHF